MLFGCKNLFGIEIEINNSFHDDFVGEGKFLVFLKDMSYGIDEPFATTFLCIKDELLKYSSKIINSVVGLESYSSLEIAKCFYCQNYSDIDLSEYNSKFLSLTKHLICWSPESAFDDGSYIIQIDGENQTRLIGFKSCAKDGNYTVDETTVREVFVEGKKFKKILSDVYECLEKLSG